MIVLLRYRAAVPLMFTIFLVEHLGRRAMFLWHPIARTSAPGGMINLVLLAVMVIGTVLSLIDGKRPASE